MLRQWSFNNARRRCCVMGWKVTITPPSRLLLLFTYDYFYKKSNRKRRKRNNLSNTIDTKCNTGGTKFGFLYTARAGCFWIVRLIEMHLTHFGSKMLCVVWVCAKSLLHIPFVWNQWSNRRLIMLLRGDKDFLIVLETLSILVLCAWTDGFLK